MHHDFDVLSKCFRAKKNVCVSQMVVGWVEMVDSPKLENVLPILAKTISHETYFSNYVCVATVVVLVEWSILTKNSSQNSIFKKCVS